MILTRFVHVEALPVEPMLPRNGPRRGYGFASMTAQISALFPGFLGAVLVAGASGALAVLILAFLSNLNAGITHYGTGSAPIYVAPGYVSQNLRWLVGFIVSVLNLAIWLGIGPIWWEAVGLW